MRQPKLLFGDLYVWFKNCPGTTFGMIQVTNKDGAISTNDTRVEFERVFLFIFKRVEPRAVELPFPKPVDYREICRTWRERCGDYQHEVEQLNQKADKYMEIHDAIAEDNDKLYAILRLAEVEMRYANWGEYHADNYDRYDVYESIKNALKGEGK
jgi:hypothetical protein